jgi:SET domain-containing protein
MPLLEKQLFIKRSTLAGAGKGLFTRKPIAKGEKIVEYRGEITTWKEVDDREGTNGYIYYVNRNHVIDAWNNKDELARYANDARGLKRTPGITNNCTYEHEGVRVFLIALKNIPAGGEIFVPYGKEYWDIMKENWRIMAAEKKKAAKKLPTSAKKAKTRTARGTVGTRVTAKRA